MNRWEEGTGIQRFLGLRDSLSSGLRVDVLFFIRYETFGDLVI